MHNHVGINYDFSFMPMARLYGIALVLGLVYSLQGHLEMDLLSTNPVRCSFFDMSTRIGSGVASDVFKCKMRLADGNYQAVTVKKFKPGYEDDISDEVDMYLKLMERVTDTNKLDAFFVRILGIVSDSGTMYQPCDGLMDPSTLDLTDPQWIVMEYCSGGELFEQRAKHSMDFTTYLQYFRYLTNGVSVLHDARILHRNLSRVFLLEFYANIL